MSEATVNEIIANAIEKANAAVESADSAAQRAITASEGFTYIASVPKVVYDITAIEPLTPTTEDPFLTYEAQRAKMITVLSDQLAQFFDTYYPLASDAFDEATNWLVNTITAGGTGIPAAVEDQIWQRGRDRIIADGSRVQSQTLLEFSSRGFSLPSGVMTNRLREDRYAQLTKTQEQSRDVAVKQAEIEIDNIKFAVEQAIKSRMAAMAAAVDYIKALMSGSDVSARLIALASEAKGRMLSATADLYRARLARDELALKIPSQNVDANMKALEISIDGFYKGVTAKVNAASAAADSYGKSAQAALVSLNAGATTSVAAFAA